MTWEENLIRKKHALAHRKACEYAKSLGPYIAKEVAIEDYTCGWLDAEAFFTADTPIERVEKVTEAYPNAIQSIEDWEKERLLIIEQLKHLLDLASTESEFYSAAVARSMLQKMGINL